MDKQQAQEIIKETFENSFNKSGFAEFIKNLLNRIDDAHFTYQGNYIPDAYKQYIKTLERIGKFSDGENNIDILVITLQKETSLERARTMQRNFVDWYLNGSRGGVLKDAALAAFVSPDKEDWRFSLVKMDYKFEKTKTGRMKVKEEFTPARRWSFLVGANEKSHTAQSRLVNILANDEQVPTLKEIEEAFDIEKVTKEFFLKYRELFLRTKEELDRIVNKDPKIKADFKAKGVDTVNFAKKLLGQMVFLYFLQKKGWFGVGRDDDWGTGSKTFLRELFDKKHGDYINFFNDVLEHLFYDALRDDRSHNDYYFSQFNCKIPFLNGGLFDPIGNYDWVHTDIIIPDKLFSNTKKTKEGDTGDGILDIFDRYNFTVKEDEPLEKEVAIDPELLGKAYEKFNAIRPDNYDEFRKALKSGRTGEENKFNKKFGVYYIPREIVHYMYQQSLINYLATEMDGKARKEDIEILMHNGEQVSENEVAALIKEQNIKEGKQKTSGYKLQLPESIRKNAKLIDEKLADITVCDPAVGSGAFPVGMMSEIVRARNVLTTFVTQASKPEKGHRLDACATYEFKRRCIEHSLYGVDIDPGAVEIAKLRLWLSLVVDEDDIKNIKPLPNLDYKVVCGNSLLGVEEDLFNAHLFSELEELKPLFFNETNPTKKQEYKKQIDDLISQITTRHEDFDFEVYFSEVFHYKGGFDVLIANPPYIGESGNKELFRKTKEGPLGQFYLGKMDYFYFFLHLALNLADTNGEVAFITTNYFLTAAGARKLRADFKQRALIRRFINFNELRIFESAQGQHNIISLLRKGTGDKPAHTCITNRTNQANPEILSCILRWNDDDTKYYKITQTMLYDGSENYIRLNREEVHTGKCKTTISSILDKVAARCEMLGRIANINQGVVSGCDYVSSRNENRLTSGTDAVRGDGIFVFDLNNPRDEKVVNNFYKKEMALLRKFYKNSDIDRYTCSIQTSKRLLYISRELDTLKDYPRIFKHLKKFKAILAQRREVENKVIKFFQLQWPRSEDIFTGEKIVVPYRSEKNVFAYNATEWFCRSDCYVITQKYPTYPLGYLLALLNSSLYFQWLLHRGKRKGKILEMFQIPLSEIPIKRISTVEQKPFIRLTDRILAITKDENYLQNHQKQAKVKTLEAEIDQLVYKLYDLTKDEIAIVEEA